VALKPRIAGGSRRGWRQERWKRKPKTRGRLHGRAELAVQHDRDCSPVLTEALCGGIVAAHARRNSNLRLVYPTSDGQSAANETARLHRIRVAAGSGWRAPMTLIPSVLENGPGPLSAVTGRSRGHYRAAGVDPKQNLSLRPGNGSSCLIPAVRNTVGDRLS